MVSNHLQWRIPHSVANFNRAATMKITPITVLLFITLLKHLIVVYDGDMDRINIYGIKNIDANERRELFYNLLISLNKPLQIFSQPFIAGVDISSIYSASAENGIDI
jgi:hypothetical protein